MGGSLTLALLATTHTALRPQDVSFSVPSNTNKKEKAFLLSNVSGYFQSNQMAALVRERRCFVWLGVGVGGRTLPAVAHAGLRAGGRGGGGSCGRR